MTFIGDIQFPDIQHIYINGDVEKVELIDDNFEITINHTHSTVPSKYVISKEIVKAFKECLDKV